MSLSERTVDVRVIVEPFEDVEVVDRANLVELVLDRAEAPSLVIDAPPEVMARIRVETSHGVLRITLAGGLRAMLADAFTTSLTRRTVRYRLRAPHVRQVHVSGLVQVTALGFGTDAPAIVRFGPPIPAVAPLPPHHP